MVLAHAVIGTSSWTVGQDHQRESDGHRQDYKKTESAETYVFHASRFGVWLSGRIFTVKAMLLRVAACGILRHGLPFIDNASGEQFVFC